MKPINKLDSSLPEVSPLEEKKILSQLNAEAYAFVPDKLLDIMAACHLDSSVAPEDEEAIVAALEGESQAFTPHSLNAVQRATNTYNPALDTTSLALNEKVKNEGADIVPNVEDQVYEKTGARRHFSFKKHWIAWTSGVLVSAASVAMVVMVTNGTFATSAEGTYVSVSVTPASYAASQTSVAYAYNSNSTTTTMNNNTPKWSFSADSSNLVELSTFSADNYSAKLVAYTPTSKVQAYEMVKNLVAPSYKSGYLETKDPSVRNLITITVSSTQSDYSSKYADEYQSQVNAALTSNKIYATVNFVFNDLSTSLKNVKDATAESYVQLFNGLSDAYNGGLDIDTIKSMPTDIVDAMNDVVDSAATAKLSLRSLRALKQGLVKSYNYYVGNEKASNLSADDAKEMRESLIRNYAGNLPWASASNLALVQSGLTKDAYYAMGSFIAGSDSGMAWDKYKDIRNYLFSTRENTVANYVSFLNEIKALADLSQNATGYLPDGYQNEMPDMGGHDHGDGPDGGGWGDGGVDWHEGPGGQPGPGGH